MELLFRYLHFLGLIGMFAGLVAQHLTIQEKVSARVMRKLVRIDGVYGLSAVVVLLTGLSMWFWVGKPASFYTGNGLFHLKVTAFVLVALLSIYPTVYFIRQNKLALVEYRIPVKITHLIRLQLGILLFVPLLAVLMARGIGL